MIFFEYSALCLRNNKWNTKILIDFSGGFYSMLGLQIFEWFDISQTYDSLIGEWDYFSNLFNDRIVNTTDIITTTNTNKHPYFCDEDLKDSAEAITSKLIY